MKLTLSYEDSTKKQLLKSLKAKKRKTFGGK